MTYSAIKKVAEANFPTRWGQFRIYGFEGALETPPNGAPSAGAGANGRGKTEPRKEAATSMPHPRWFGFTRNALPEMSSTPCVAIAGSSSNWPSP